LKQSLQGSPRWAGVLGVSTHGKDKRFGVLARHEPGENQKAKGASSGAKALLLWCFMPDLKAYSGGKIN
jgi:hypothetical protein